MLINKNDPIHFVGIKGSGMSALAQILHDMGFKIKGSDSEKYFFTQEKLEKRGIPLTPFHEGNVNPGEVVVASRAFDKTNPEVGKAQKDNEFYYYFDFLGRFAEQFPTSIAVSGSHGKTTTTGLLSHALSGLSKTSFLIGDGTGRGMEDSEYFAFEACEYKNHFHSYKPDYAIVTNIDFDHPDFFKDKEAVVQSFETFARNVKKAVVVFGDQEECRGLQKHNQVWTYGFGEDNDLCARILKTDDDGTYFEVYGEEIRFGTVFIPLHGKHQVLNALSVISILFLEGYCIEEVKGLFSDFNGVNRRFNETHIGTNVLIDDYAHHPSELRATLDSVKMKYPNKKIISLFQPHTYTRTKALLQEFADAMYGFDVNYVVEIFGSAREAVGADSVSNADIVRCMSNKNSYPINFELPSEIFEVEDSVILFLGAGNINELKDAYIGKVNERKLAVV